MRIIGLDPGLRVTGWGVIDQAGNRLSPVAHGTVKTDAALPMAQRLVQLEKALVKVIAEYSPDEAAVEETFVNSGTEAALTNPQPLDKEAATDLRRAFSRGYRED